MKSVVAIDLGAGSGRVMYAVYENNQLLLNEMHRFENINVEHEGQLCWDTDHLINEIKTGINKVIALGYRPDCMAIDGWGVDFVLTDSDGQRLGETVTYRDSRTDGLMEQTIAQLGKDQLYQRTGIQLLPFNTLYQLIAIVEQQPSWLARVKHLQFMPDYLGYRLTGVMNCEYSNASTSQMVHCQTGQWDETLLAQLGIPAHWLLPISQPNRVIASYPIEGSEQSIPFASITSHDTASAVLAVPKTEEHVAYLSSGTWSLMGIESEQAILSETSQAFNITNEGGAEGKFRVLKNIMGLWLIQGIQKELKSYTFAQLVEDAKTASAFKSLIDPDHASLLNPVSMIEAIQQLCAQSQQPIPTTPGELTRCALESLAMQYRTVWQALNQLAPQPLAGIHIIGGGSQNQLLNQFCADACQCPVWAGPIEASALGNVCGQLIAIGAIENVSAARKIIKNSFAISTFQPNPSNNFDAQADRYFNICNALPLTEKTL